MRLHDQPGVAGEMKCDGDDVSCVCTKEVIRKRKLSDLGTSSSPALECSTG